MFFQFDTLIYSLYVVTYSMQCIETNCNFVSSTCNKDMVIHEAKFNKVTLKAFEGDLHQSIGSLYLVVEDFFMILRLFKDMVFK